MASQDRRLFEETNHAKLYRTSRPGHPKELFRKILTVVDENRLHGQDNRSLAVDVGCGSGQATFLLAPHFKRVRGFDVSRAMVEEAQGAAAEAGVDNVTFGFAKIWEMHVVKLELLHLAVAVCRVSAAEDLASVETGSCNLVTAFHVVHWLDIPKFYKELERILAPGGVAAFCLFQVLHSDVVGFPQIKETVWNEFFEVIKEDAHPRFLQHCLRNYQDVPPPFPKTRRIEPGEFKNKVHLSLKGYIEHLSSLSTMQNYARRVGKEEAQKLLSNLTSSLLRIMREDPSKATEDVRLTIVHRYFGMISVKD